MDDFKAGLVIRAVRLRRGLRQSDVARVAGVSQTFVSLLERGALDQAALRSVRKVAAALGIRVALELRWRGADLAKLVDERHASLVLAASRRLAGAGWEVTAERTFSIFGERGSVDIVAWHPRFRALLIVEVKSELVDLQDLLAAFDRKRRLTPTIAREMGLRPLVYGAVIAFPEESGVRKAVDGLSDLFATTYPARRLRSVAGCGSPRATSAGCGSCPSAMRVLVNDVGADRGGFDDRDHSQAERGGGPAERRRRALRSDSSRGTVAVRHRWPMRGLTARPLLLSKTWRGERRGTWRAKRRGKGGNGRGSGGGTRGNRR